MRLALIGVGLALGMLVCSAPALGATASAVSAGYKHTCAVVDGGAKCWGFNSSGQLGNNSTVDSGASVDVSGLGAGSGVSAVSAGQGHTCALVSGGVKCWGSNSFGQLGNNSTADSHVPVGVSGLGAGSGVTAISAGYDHTCAVVNGGVKCWGSSFAGQLGDNSDFFSPVPVDVSGLLAGSGATAVSAGQYHTCAVVNGGAKCWGFRGYGQLGDGTDTGPLCPNSGVACSKTPVDVSGLGAGSGVTVVSAGSNHTCAVVDGGAKCWGENFFGELGNGTNTGPNTCQGFGGGATACSTTPVGVIGLGAGSGLAAVSAGGSHTCAPVGGGAKCWGDNSSSELGTGTSVGPQDCSGFPCSQIPVDVSGLGSGSGVTAVSAGTYHSCAVVSGGVRCWGANDKGQLGDNTTTPSSEPVNVDLEGPVITVPGTLTSEAESAGGARVDFVVSAVDDIDGLVPVSCDHTSGSVFPIGKTTVSCSAHDSVGHTSTASFDVVVAHAGAPVISVPPGVSASAVDASGARVDFVVSAVDAVDGPITPSCSPASGSKFKLGTTKVTCTASDSAGNTSTASFDVVVRDVTGPVITGERITGEAQSPNGVVVSYTVSAVDAVDGPVTATCAPPSGSVFAIGTTVVSCTAVDKAGNVGTGSFEIVISHAGAPVLAVPEDQLVEATGPSGAKVRYSASAFDLVDGAVTPACSPASGSTFKLGTTKVSCTATDKAGNATSASFQVTVRDSTAPKITAPKSRLVLATSRHGASVTYTVGAHDKVDGNIAPTCKPRSGSRFKIGTTAVRCSARDKTGNIAATAFPVTVRPSFTHTRIITHRDGTITLDVKQPGPGQINILVTAWKDNIARTALLQPAPGRFVYSRWHGHSNHPHTYHVLIHPYPKAQTLLNHPAYQITLRLWITYKLPTGQNQTQGHYGLHLP